MNEKKSEVDRPAQRKFLGFRVFQRKGEVALGVAKRAMERCHRRLHQLTRRTRSGQWDEGVKQINASTRGGVGYYRLADTPSVFQELDEWLRRRLRQRLWQRWKKPRARA